jgi:hypothetical protein
MLTKQQNDDLKRWYPLPQLKPVHLEYWSSSVRFIVGKAGRRSYKTEIAKRKVIEIAMAVPGNYFIAAPTIPQVKLIYWKDMCDMSFRSMQKSQVNKTDLIIPFDNGSTIQLLGMEKPKRFEGPYWTGGILDEFAYYKSEAWYESIRPALDTEIPGMAKPWCIIISKPNGKNHFYDLYQYAKTAQDPQWAAFEWTSEDVLSSEAIESAKRELSPRQYRQEYLGEFVSSTGRIYDDYNEENYTTDTIKPHEQIHYYCDFNFTPMSHGIGCYREHHCVISTRKVVKAFYLLDEIILESAVGADNITEFVERYKSHLNKNIRIYGDRSGKNGEKHAIISEYVSMERILEAHGWTVDRRVKDANPSIKDSQNAVRAKICNAAGERTLFVNPVRAPWTHQGLDTVVVKEGSTFLEDDTNKYQHITTAIRYMVDYEEPIENGMIEDLSLFTHGEYPDEEWSMT